MTFFSFGALLTCVKADVQATRGNSSWSGPEPRTGSSNSDSSCSLQHPGTHCLRQFLCASLLVTVVIIWFGYLWKLASRRWRLFLPMIDFEIQEQVLELQSMLQVHWSKAKAMLDVKCSREILNGKPLSCFITHADVANAGARGSQQRASHSA